MWNRPIPTLSTHADFLGHCRMQSRPGCPHLSLAGKQKHVMLHTPFRYETGIAQALRMQPSAPALGMPPSSKGVKATAAASRERVDNLSACAIATRPGHLLTRLSLHGQGVRAIDGLEACYNLQVLVSDSMICIFEKRGYRPTW